METLINLDTEQMFFKITNSSENHNGLQYKDGLIIDHLPFADTGSCVKG
jgi:hypothetical protein